MSRQRRFEFSRVIYCTGLNKRKFAPRQRRLKNNDKKSVVADATRKLYQSNRAINYTAKFHNIATR